MRVLFATYSEKTHFQPLVSLAWALRTARARGAGREVQHRVVTGLTFFPGCLGWRQLMGGSPWVPSA